MTEPARADLGSTMGALHFQISKLLVATIISATAATGALVVTVLVELPPSTPPPPGPNGLPPPPPSLQPLAVFPIVTGLFVLAWLAVLVVFSRDQILRRIHDTRDVALAERFAGLRADLAADRERELRELGRRIETLTAEYGEQRETDGYLNGMRVATADEPVEPNVRAIRRTPPQR
jgi:hypothetical protein